MSKKGKHLDVLGEAHLPADLLTHTLGSGYGIGEYPDMDYGLGVLEGDIVPGSTPSPEYKIEADLDLDICDGEGNGFFDEPDDSGLDFTDFMKEGGLQDLSWLEMNEQDPDRLPKNTEMDTAIPELEEAWGIHRRTDGIHFFDNVDLEQARYEAGLDDKAAAKHSDADLARVVRKAMRRSTVGHDLNAILHEAAEALGHEAPRIRNAMKLVVEEHGLAGNVFIRAAAFPGIEQGKWAKTLKGLHARYIIMDERTITGSVHVHDNNFNGKKAVTEVPWAEALDHYRPYLEASGRKVAAGDPRAALRGAFLSLPDRTPRDSHLPTHRTASERISRQAAWSKFNSAPVQERKVYTDEYKHLTRARKVAWGRICTWIDAGLIPMEVAVEVGTGQTTGTDMLRQAAAYIVQTKDASDYSGLPNDVRLPQMSREAADKALAGVKLPDPIDVSNRPLEAKRRQAHLTLARWAKAEMLDLRDARRLAKSNAAPLDVLRAATSLMTAAKDVADYSGISNDARVAVETNIAKVWDTLKKAESKTKATQAQVDSTVKDRRAQSTRAARKIAEVQGLVGKIKAAIDRGVRGKPLQDLILRTIPRGDVKLASKYLNPILRESGALDATVKTAKTYEGPTYRPVAQKVATVTPHAREVEAMVQWTRRALQEGFAGEELNQLLGAKFSRTVREAGHERLASLRDNHEGGAGFIYVDASAYASKTGTKGCEAGALKHRTNSLRYVLGMDRCATCSLVRTAADGSRSCSKYKKQIVQASDLPDEIASLRRDNVKSANMTDQESLASLFAPEFDPTEYNLRNASLEDIEFEATADTAELSSVLFGGMEW